MLKPTTFHLLAALAAGPGVRVETKVSGAQGVWTGEVVDADSDSTLLVELGDDAAAEMGASCVWVTAEDVEGFEVL